MSPLCRKKTKNERSCHINQYAEELGAFHGRQAVVMTDQAQGQARRSSAGEEEMSCRRVQHRELPSPSPQAEPILGPG